MAARKLALVVCTLGLLQTSFAGSERFWVFSKLSKPTTEEAWDDLSPEEQRILIKRYQNIERNSNRPRFTTPAKNGMVYAITR